jgi:6-phosphogluconolactonase
MAATLRSIMVLALAAGCATSAAPMKPAPARSAFVYVGGYRPEIGVFTLDLSSGALKHVRDVAAGTAPSFLAFDPSGRHLFALDEVDIGRVRAFARDPATGALHAINDVSSAGIGPAHLSVDRGGHFVLVANYADAKSGTVAVLPIDGEGRLGQPVDTHDFGPGAMPHMIAADPSNRWIFVPCKGGSFVAGFSFDAAVGQLTPLDPARVDLPPGAGPRHVAFHPGKDVVYLINEQAMTIVVYSLDRGNGALTPQQTLSTLPAGTAIGRGFSTAEIEVHPSGKFLYGSNRGHDSLVIYGIDDAGRLSPIGHETRGIRKPRHFQIDPTGALLLVANQDGDSITVFRIDQTSGALTPIGAPVPAGKQPSYVGVVLAR